MKNIKIFFLISATLLVLGGCDEDFVDINTNPYAVIDIDPALLFVGAQRTHLGGWETEHTIAQQFVNPHNSGATLGPNFNADIDNFNNGKWDGSYPGSIKNMVQAIALLDGNTERGNLLSILRIWKAQVFMGLVDTHADVPYFDAGQAYLKGSEYFYPKYDDDAAIYADLEKELKEAVAALNPNGDYVAADLFYGDRGSIKTGTAAAQVDKWKKLGNSLLLRLGMRYSKVDPTKAASIVSAAFNGGVMKSNDDNAYVKYDGTLFTNGANGGLVNNNPYFYYAAEPFVDQLKATNDPRTPFLVATFANPAAPLGDPNPNTNIADQFGVPVGVINTDLAKAPFRGAKGGGYNYSQMNVNVVASLTAPDFWVTYSEVSLLLAEAAQRGWIPGGEAAAKQYYEDGIRADIKRYALYPKATTVSDADIATFLASPGVAYNAADALKLINTQLWIVYIRNGTQAWANFRRSGFPALKPNLFNNLLNGGFVRRLSYPDYELAQNRENYLNAVKAIGGKDDLITRVFWDKE
ncbi:MAG: SusD/RagB family nutrient-binding outer membrane lipoprotein [Saprospiraceae bacterium]|nr:SusD/RagB family nutrient-binding outer membrane lipoprotein [Saprospiraceae bacterium]